MLPQNIRTSLRSFILHLHPPRIDKRAVRFNRTFGLGGISALLIVILIFTGLILRFSYVPTVEYAYNSIVELQQHTLFGQFIRNLHHLAANLLIVTSFLHLLRVYYSQSFTGKRAENWIFGLALFLLILASSFTGYLLPWDQLSFWAVTVITKVIEYVPFLGPSIADFVRSGEVVNGRTLLNFYNLHTGIIPILLLLLMSYHFWLVRKAGGVALPKIEDKVPKVPIIQHLVIKEVMVAAIILAVITLGSVFYHAPLLAEANPLQSPNPTKAPWYFAGAQELLLHLHPVFSGVMIPAALTFFFIYLPFFKYKNQYTGVWFNSEAGKKIVIQSAIISFVFTCCLIYVSAHYLHFELWFKSWPSWISTGIIPLLLYVLPMGLFLFSVSKKSDVGITEIIMSMATIVFASYIAMMMVTIFFRGTGMLLIF